MYTGPGQYRHFKGDLYTAIGIATNAVGGAKMVVYTATVRVGYAGEPEMFVRLLENFNEEVVTDVRDGPGGVGPKRVDRFVKVGP